MCTISALRISLRRRWIYHRFDAILVNYCARLIFPGHVPDFVKQSLAAYRGPKLVAVQDEYDDTNRLHEELRRLGTTVVLDLVPQESLEYVYPRNMFSGRTLRDRADWLCLRRAFGH